MLNLGITMKILADTAESRERLERSRTPCWNCDGAEAVSVSVAPRDHLTSGERGLRRLVRSWESTQSFQELDFTSNGFFFCTRCGAEKCFESTVTRV